MGAVSYEPMIASCQRCGVQPATLDHEARLWLCDSCAGRRPAASTSSPAPSPSAGALSRDVGSSSVPELRNGVNQRGRSPERSSCTSRVVTGDRISGGQAGRSPGFAAVPNELLRDVSLSEGARLLYAVLLGLKPESDGTVLATLGQLAGYVGASVSTIQRRVAELAGGGRLEWKRGGYGRPNRYELKDVVGRSPRPHPALPDDAGGVEAGRGRPGALQAVAGELAGAAEEAAEREDDVGVLDAEAGHGAGVGAVDAARGSADADLRRDGVGVRVARHGVGQRTAGLGGNGGGSLGVA
jgi:hypothetical protein